MNYIKNYILPIKNLNDSNINQDSDNDNNLSLNLTITKPFINKTYVNLNIDKPLILNIPQYLNIQTIKSTLESSYNVIIQTYIINNESPKALIDLKVHFNARTITNIQDFNDKVNEFNIQCENKLSRLKNPNKPVEI